MQKQVDKDNYRFQKYSNLERWVSYYHQINETVKICPRNVLEVGVGDGVYGNYLQAHGLTEYTSLDIAEDLDPDVVGSVDAMPFDADAFDVVVAFEVLEHLPFERFEQALAEMRRVARSHVIISLPHFGPPIKISFKIPFFPEVKLCYKIPWPKKHIFNDSHYWEIGKKRYSERKIRRIIERFFTVESHFIPFENQYHHFYTLRK